MNPITEEQLRPFLKGDFFWPTRPCTSCCKWVGYTIEGGRIIFDGRCDCPLHRGAAWYVEIQDFLAHLNRREPLARQILWKAFTNVAERNSVRGLSALLRRMWHRFRRRPKPFPSHEAYRIDFARRL